jgi:hypothetical protein
MDSGGLIRWTHMGSGGFTWVQVDSQVDSHGFRWIGVSSGRFTRWDSRGFG